LVRPVTRLYLWKNNGGPIYHADVQIIDLAQAAVGRCGQLDTFQIGTFAILNPSHYAIRIRDDDIEFPFFVSPQHVRYQTFFNNAVYGVEFDANEVSYSRGIPAGEYTVNVHLYRNTANIFPIPVSVVTSVKKSARDAARQLLASKIDLAREGDEVTVDRFELSREGGLIPGSVHSLQRNLRSLKL
jgi:hypothetical protein